MDFRSMCKGNMSLEEKPNIGGSSHKSPAGAGGKLIPLWRECFQVHQLPYRINDAVG
jgi:hypothetical protein